MVYAMVLRQEENFLFQEPRRTMIVTFEASRAQTRAWRTANPTKGTRDSVQNPPPSGSMIDCVTTHQPYAEAAWA